MPVVRHGWTIIQSICLRVGAIEFLRAIQRRTHPVRFFNAWWAFWVETYGPPVPEHGTTPGNYEEFVAEYRMRIFRTIIWHASRGRYLPSNALARFNRIIRIHRLLVEDIIHYREEGRNFNTPQSPERHDNYITGFSISRRQGGD